VIEQPRLDPYSIPARICFAVAVVGGVALIAVAIMSIYFM